MLFQEEEGLTIICTKEAAVQHDIEYIFPCRMITLNVHSSLEAIGFLAAITTKLKTLQMGVNPVSGFYHDHIFVPQGREREALAVLEEMVRQAKLDHKIKH